MVRRAIPFLVFAILASILLWPLAEGRVLVPASMLGKMPPWVSATDAHWNALTWDGIAYFYPARHLLGAALRLGELPLWNPHQMCGMPFLASPQSAVLYPPNWIFGLMPTDLAFGLLAWIHLFAAGSFTYLFLRKLGLVSAASVFGGSAFMLSGWSIAWLHLPVFLSSGIWLPLTLLLITVAHERRSALHAALAGGTIALSLFGGHPQIWAYLLMASGLYWVYLAITGRRTARPLQSLALVALTFAVGFLLAAPQLLPTMELASLSHRGGSAPTIDGFRAYNSLAMPVRNLIGFLVPDFCGNPAKGNFWGFGEYTEFCGYVGLLPLLLLPSAFIGRGRGNAAFFAMLALLALLMASGTVVNRLFYFGIPGFSSSGSPARIIFLYTFAVTVLGSIGFDRLSGLKAKHAVGVSLGSAGGLVAVGSALFVVNAVFVAEMASVSASDLLASAYAPVMTALAFLALGLVAMLLGASGRLKNSVTGGILVGLLAVDLLVFGSGYNIFSAREDVYPVFETAETLRDAGGARIMPLNDEWRLRQFPSAVLPPNAATVYYLYDVQGYDSLYPVRYKRLLDAAAGRDSSPPENGNMVFARNPDSQVWDLLGVRYSVSPDGDVRENRSALPRAFVVHQVRRVSDADALELLANGGIDLRSTALVEEELSLGGSERSGSSSALIRGYTNNRVFINVNNPDAPGLLVLTDQFYPGWTARIGRRVLPVMRVDYCFRGVLIPRGSHQVVFSFEPQSHVNGLRLASLGGLTLLGLLIRSVRRRGDRR